MYKAILIMFITMCSCVGNPQSRVYVTGKQIAPESGTTLRYCLFIKRVDGTKFFFGTTIERIIDTDKASFDKLKVGDTLKNKY
jgi:hypothetical protein